MAHIIKSVFTKVKKLDLFSRSITLNYSGNKNYKSCLGTLISLLIVSICGIYSVIFFTNMLRRKRFTSTNGVKHINFNDEPMNISLNDEGNLFNCPIHNHQLIPFL